MLPLPQLSKRIKRNKEEIDSYVSGCTESAIPNVIDIQINMPSRKQFITKMAQFIALIEE